MMQHNDPTALKTNKAPNVAFRASGSGDEWNRTTDTRIFSPLLYQLSYITGTDLKWCKLMCFSIFRKKL